MFAVPMSTLKTLVSIIIMHVTRKTLLAALKQDKPSIKVPIKYNIFPDVFLPNLEIDFPDLYQNQWPCYQASLR